MSTATSVELLAIAAAELATIRRAKDFARWKDETRHRLNDALSDVEPFRDYRHTWIFTGDGGRVAAGSRFGDWAIDRLLLRLSPEEVLAGLATEIDRNSATYSEVSPVFGVQIEENCDLGDGVMLEAAPEGIVQAFARDLWPPSAEPLPEGTAFLRQTFTVSPAFEQRAEEATAPIAEALTVPDRAVRDRVRSKVRLACLLASTGAVEFPLSALRPDRSALFAAGDGDQARRPVHSVPRVPYPVEAARVAVAFKALAAFDGGDALTRAIDRLGRSRSTTNQVDRALELGMAAEIALMHDTGSNNTEITYKIASRAAWLVGSDVPDREAVFNAVKDLYYARSQAVHSGVLSAKARLDLEASDRLVSRVLFAIAEHGRFPDWTCLVLGGGPERTVKID